MKRTNLRREAIGRECQIRLEGCTTAPCCVCHWRQIGISGLGLKSPDIFGAFGCASCHDKVDRSERGNVETQLDFARAVFRTQAILLAETNHALRTAQRPPVRKPVQREPVRAVDPLACMGSQFGTLRGSL